MDNERPQALIEANRERRERREKRELRKQRRALHEARAHWAAQRRQALKGS